MFHDPIPDRRLRSDERGNVAVLFSLMMIPVFGIAGAAIDFSETARVKTRMQQAADAAALAAGTARDLSSSQRVDLAVRHYNENLGGDLAAGTALPEVSIGDSDVTISASRQVPTSFLSLVGIDEIPVEVTSAVTTAGKTLELSVMLDVTGSMQGGKLDDMKDAANDLLGIVLPEGSTGTRVALVPFASYVNVGSVDRTLLTGRTDYPNNSCVLERKRGSRTSEDPPILGTNEFWIKTSSSANCPPVSPVVPLTSNRQTLDSAITGLVADGATAGHLGTAWAWYTISPQWATRWPSGSAPVGYNQPDNIKAVVLMTDGNYTEYYRNPDQSQANCDGRNDCQQSRLEAKAVCDAMKARLDATGNEAIMIFTVGFGLDAEGTSNGDFARDTLRYCASYDPQDPETDPALRRKLYFFPYSGADMRAAFQQIGQALSAAKNSARLSR